VWEKADDDDPEEAPTASAEDVDLAVEATLEQGANAFQWIWNGLPPIEKVIMAAMAGTGRLSVSRELLAEKLNQNGVCLVRGELELAPETLIRWDLIRRFDNGFRFTIPLLQRWVAENRPLRRIKAELDSLEPMAEELFTNAERKFEQGDLKEAERLLRRTLAVNPHHVPAQLMLGQVHLGKGSPAEAVAIMESAYRVEPLTARNGLITALLAQVEAQSSEDEQWQTISRILRIDPEQAEAQKKRKTILRGWAEKAVKEKDYEAALNAYGQLDDKVGTAEARKRLRWQSLTKRWSWLSRARPAR